MASVLVTGASQGIGRAIAVELAGRGHRVIATARRPEALADLPADLPADQRLRLDVTDQRSVDAAVRAAGRIDVLVSNAGETGSGRLVFVSSIQGRLVLPMIGPYGASKWALEALAETLALETGHFGVRVTVVQPGAVSSGGAERARVFLADDDPYRPLYESLGALRGDAITPEEVAATVADVIDRPEPPLRVPAGAPAERVLRARKQAPEDQPFLPAALNW